MTKKDIEKRGAPLGNSNAAKPRSERKSSRIIIQVTAKEKEDLVNRAGKNLSKWILDKLK